jgi:ribosomal protein S1
VKEQEEEDFATMFEASVKARQFVRGQTIEGTIVAFGPDVAFVNVGGKGEAEIDLAEFATPTATSRCRSAIAFKRWSSPPAVASCSRAGHRSAATQRELEDAFRAGLAVEGKGCKP